jgi:hypothetical protein
LSRLRSELILDGLDELVVQVEETFEEVGDDEEVARAAGEVRRGGACVGDALTQVGDIGAQRGEACACDVCSDESQTSRRSSASLLIGSTETGVAAYSDSACRPL